MLPIDVAHAERRFPTTWTFNNYAKMEDELKNKFDDLQYLFTETTVSGREKNYYNSLGLGLVSSYFHNLLTGKATAVITF